jgi:hypothetical protein
VIDLTTVLVIALFIALTAASILAVSWFFGASFFVASLLGIPAAYVIGMVGIWAIGKLFG